LKCFAVKKLGFEYGKDCKRNTKVDAASKGLSKVSVVYLNYGSRIIIK
jgi:hypothetical protein